MLCTICKKEMGKNHEQIRFFTKNKGKKTCNGFCNLCDECYPKYEKRFINFLD